MSDSPGTKRAAEPLARTGVEVSLRGVVGFWRFFGARAISILGDRISEVVIPLLVLDMTGSPLAAGAVEAAGQLPALLFALWLGAFVDRSPKRRLMMAADTGRRLAFAVLAISLAWDRFSMALLVAVVIVVGLGDLLFLASASAFLPGLVGRRRLVAANGYLEAADAGATLVGPAFGALILQTLGAAVAVGSDAASFAVSAVLLAGVRQTAAAAPAPLRAARGRKAALMGIRLLWRIPQQRLLQIAYVGLNLETGAIVLLIVALTKDVLKLSAFGTGLVLTGAGLGGLLTSTLLAPRLGRRRWGPLRALLLVIMASAIVAIALAGGGAQAFLANAVLDGTTALAFVVAGTARQALTPDALLGRVATGARLVNSLARTTGVFAAGLLIGGLGHRQALGVFAALLVPIGVGLSRASVARVPLGELEPLDLSTRSAPS